MDEQDARAISSAQAELLAARQEEVEVKARVRAAKTRPAPPAGGRAEVDDEPNEALDDWLDDNPWFERKKLRGKPANAATELAAVLSNKIASEDGIGSDDPRHFKRLSRQMREAMPHLFDGSEAPARGSKPARRRDPDEDDDDDDGLPPSGGAGRRGEAGDRGRGADGGPAITALERRLASTAGIDLNDKDQLAAYNENRGYSRDRVRGAR
jgi:hypothetical protein